MSGQSGVPLPPHNPDILVDRLPAGTRLFHAHHRRFRPNQFNPGPRPTSRFSFFPSASTGDPVPAFYAGRTEQVAVAETLLHDVPLTGGQLTWTEQETRVMSAVSCSRELSLAQLHGGVLCRLGITARQLTDTEQTEYLQTVRWRQPSTPHAPTSTAWCG